MRSLNIRRFLTILPLATATFLFAATDHRRSTVRSSRRSRGSRRADAKSSVPNVKDIQYTATLTLPADRCKDGYLDYPGVFNGCKVTVRGDTVTSPPEGLESHYQRGSNVGGKPCYFLKEEFPHGATPYPSKGYYITKFMDFSSNHKGKGHWYEQKEVVENGKKKLTPDYTKPTPVFNMMLDAGNKIPPRRDIGTLRMHMHGQDRLISKENRCSTWGCPKLPPDCMWKFYNWSQSKKHPFIKMEVKRV